MTAEAAVITDIHANLPALQAALARIDALGIERLYCGCDLVGYGPHSNEVVALVAERGIPTIYGNYDYAIARDLEDCGCAYLTPHDRELGQGSVDWTLTHADRRSKDWMRALPLELRFALGATSVHLVHGSPRKGQRVPVRGQAGPPLRASRRRRGRRRAGLRPHPQAVVRSHGGMLFVNCGSVGKPKDGDPRGAFAVLRETAAGVEVTIERVAYDAEAVAAQVREAGLPAEFADKLVAAA